MLRFYMVENEKEKECEHNNKNFELRSTTEKETNKKLEDNAISKEEENDLDYLDWIFDKGWLRVKKTDF